MNLQKKKKKYKVNFKLHLMIYILNIKGKANSEKHQEKFV